MITPDDATPRNVQNVADGASAMQINDPQAPVVLNPQHSTINFNYQIAARRERGESSGTGELPQSGALYFVGRVQDLQALHERLQEGTTLAISAISGLGGIGKTELALQYALQHRDLGTYPGGICWLKAREVVGTQIVSFARSHLQLQIPEDLELAEQVAFCWKKWHKEATLIVLDDVQTYEAIKSFLPPQKAQFKVLMTTRSRFGSPVQNYEIKVLSEAASLELLRSLVSDGRIDQDLATAKQVCEWLGYLPLGLELVGRYLARKKGFAIAKLWERLQAQKLAAKALLEAEQGMTASLGVTAAFELSWQELDLNAQQLAGLLSLFALAEIPWELVQACLPEADEEELEDLRDEQLVNLSLLTYEREGVYQLHQLLREFFVVKREQMAEDEAMKRSFSGVMAAIAQQIPYRVTLEAIEQFTPAIPHLKEAATTLNPWLTDEELITPSNRIAWFYAGQSAFSEAEEWYKHCRAIATQRLGADHPDVATSLDNLALLYEAQGRYEEAVSLSLQALEIRQQQLGQDHSDVAASLNTLAGLYESKGRYEEAEPLYLQALEITQRQLEQDYSDVAAIVNNLAELYRLQGRYEEAEPLYLKALESNQRRLGQNHPNLAVILDNLALLYEAQERYEEAERLCLRALTIWQQQLGENHPDVSTSLNNLALLYQSQGRYEEAEPLYLRSLEIKQQQLGQDHPDVSTSLNDLALLYHRQGRPEEAELLYLRSLEIRQQQLGQNHPHVATSLNNLAALYRSQGRYPEAEQLHLQAITIRRQQLRPDHPHLELSLNNLALLYEAQGRYQEAEPFFLQVLEIRQQRSGQDHPDVAKSLNDLGLLYEAQGRYREAEPFYMQALTISEKILGVAHPGTINIRRNYAVCLKLMVSAFKASS